MSAPRSQPRAVDQFAATLLLLISLAAILYWGVRLASSAFREPLQLAVVGHYAPWRRQGARKAQIHVGTDRRHNDIVLHDRKASPDHFVLERQGGAGRWWALLHNRSQDRRIVVRRAPTYTQRLDVNRYTLQDGDRFLLPLRLPNTPQNASKLQNIDWCSPSQVLGLLRSAQPSTSAKAARTPEPKMSRTRPAPPRRRSRRQGSKPKSRGKGRGSRSVRRKASVLPVPVRKPQLVRQVPFLVRMSRFPLQLDHHKLRYRRPSKKGETATSERWLPEHQRYRLWQGAPGDWLEYRRGKWQVLQKGRWRPLRTQEIPALQHVHLPRLSARPRYQLGQARAACAFPLRPETIPGGLEVAGHARLLFVRQRLYLQHLGQDGPGLQILPKRQAPRLLGRVRVYSGDLISVGQLTYRLHLDARGARLMLTRTPSSTPLMPFFQRYRSPQLTMRRTLIRGRKLLLTGGEGVAPGADRWRIHLSLAGEVGTTQLADPYRPFLLLAHRNDGTLQLSPQKDIPLYKAKPDGTFLSKQITSTQTIEPGPTLYYANRLYLRAFQPSYRGLAWRSGLLWVLMAGGMMLFLYWMLTTGRLAWSPVPTTSLLQGLPASDRRRHLLDKLNHPGRSLWQRLLLSLTWMPILLLLPIALFLNGLGLYVLATLSLSSLGLNNNSFLYRQLLWSLVGLWVLAAIVVWPRGFLRRLWTRWRPAGPTRVQLHLHEHGNFWERRSFQLASLGYGLTLLLLAWLFRNAMLLAPGLLLYGYGLFLLWEVQRSRYAPERRRSLHYFFITLGLLAAVPLLGLIFPPLVHNRFFLVVPGFGTVKLSEFAILSAILFFAAYLGDELFALRQTIARREANAEASAEVAREVSVGRERWERLGGAFFVAFLYLFLLAAIGALYTAQGDLGPGLILTLCFSLYLLFSFAGRGVDRLTTWGNAVRIGVVLGGLLLLVILPNVLAWMFPQWAEQSAELQKINERLALWQQPWRYIVGEQILQNQWSLAAHNDAFQWFNNLHSDFVLTAVVRVLSTWWGYAVLLLTACFPLLPMGAAWMRWVPLSPEDAPTLVARKRRATISALILLFGGLYFFSQNFIHIGSVLRLTPMTGVTLTWVSSGGTSVVVCYAVLGLLMRQLRLDPQQVSLSAQEG